MLDALAIYAGDIDPYRDNGEGKDFWDRDVELEKLVGPKVFRLNHHDYRWLLSRHNHLKKFGFYPFGNGMWGDQPQWLLDDFATLDLYLEWREIRRTYFKKARDPKAEHA